MSTEYTNSTELGNLALNNIEKSEIIVYNSKVYLFTKRMIDIVGSLSGIILLSPIFFASIGINMEIPKMTVSIIIMTIVLVAVAMLSKIIGCGLGAKICGYSKKEIIQIGTGMMARGEVALVIANKGIKLGIMNTYFLPSIIIMIITAAICTPILLKKAYTV